MIVYSLKKNGEIIMNVSDEKKEIDNDLVREIIASVKAEDSTEMIRNKVANVVTDRGGHIDRLGEFAGFTVKCVARKEDAKGRMTVNISPVSMRNAIWAANDVVRIDLEKGEIK